MKAVAAAGGAQPPPGALPPALRALKLSLAYSRGRLRERLAESGGGGAQALPWRVQDGFLDAVRLQIVRGHAPFPLAALPCQAAG